MAFASNKNTTLKKRALDDDLETEFTFLNLADCSAEEKSSILKLLQDDKKIEADQQSQQQQQLQNVEPAFLANEERGQREATAGQGNVGSNASYIQEVKMAPMSYDYSVMSAPQHYMPPTVYINNMTANLNVHHPMGGPQLQEDHLTQSMPPHQGPLHQPMNLHHQQPPLMHDNHHRYQPPPPPPNQMMQLPTMSYGPPPPSMLPPPQFGSMYQPQMNKANPQQGGTSLYQYGMIYPYFPAHFSMGSSLPPMGPTQGAQMQQRNTVPLIRGQGGMIHHQPPLVGASTSGQHYNLPPVAAAAAPPLPAHFTFPPAPQILTPMMSAALTTSLPSATLPSEVSKPTIPVELHPSEASFSTGVEIAPMLNVEEDVEKSEVESYGFEIPDEVDEDDNRELNENIVFSPPRVSTASTTLAKNQDQQPDNLIHEKLMDQHDKHSKDENETSEDGMLDAPSPPGVKSWASLFHKESKAAGDGSKPMARIHPFSASGTVNSGDGFEAEDGQQVNTISGISGGGLKGLNHLEISLAMFLKNYSHVHKPLFSIKPCGLSNRNNWCFVNSIMQALSACPPFFNLIKSLPEDIARANAFPATATASSPVKMLASVYAFISEFTPLENFPRMNHRKNKKAEDLPLGKTFEASSIFQMLLNLSSDTFRVIEGRQEDAEEYLTFLLNGLNDEMVGLLKLVDETAVAHAEASLSSVMSDEEEDVETEWKEVGPKNRSCITRRGGDLGASVCIKTPLAELFQGQMRSEIKRSGETTATLQPFFTLQLDIQSEAIKNVSDALLHNFSVETIDGYICSKTKQEVEASRSLLFEELPPILILHLKRFLYNETSGGCQKLLKNIDFPVDLEISRDILSVNSRNKYQTRQRQYKLFSIVYHNGTEATKGHYVTDLYHTGLSTWIHCDDSHLKAVPESLVLAHSASSLPYILFYRRGDTMGSGNSVADKSHKAVGVPASAPTKPPAVVTSVSAACGKSSQ